MCWVIIIINKMKQQNSGNKANTLKSVNNIK